MRYWPVGCKRLLGGRPFASIVLAKEHAVPTITGQDQRIDLPRGAQMR